MKLTQEDRDFLEVIKDFCNDNAKIKGSCPEIFVSNENFKTNEEKKADSVKSQLEDIIDVSWRKEEIAKHYNRYFCMIEIPGISPDDLKLKYKYGMLFLYGSTLFNEINYYLSVWFTFPELTKGYTVEEIKYTARNGIAYIEVYEKINYKKDIPIVKIK